MTDQQADFFDVFERQRLVPETVRTTDPNVIEEDKPRLVGQNKTILEMLKRGPVTNDELAGIARKYTSRLSDLRKHGYVIECERLGGGLTKYELKE